jgi:pSer/pThr/pTyr-binding forkhead associated (FHA) protein
MSDSFEPDVPKASFVLRIGSSDVALRQLSTVIGRDPRAGIVLDDSLVSRRHAELRLEDGVLVLQDLDSRNGVLLNGVPLARVHALKALDEIRVGSQRFVVRVIEAGDRSPNDVLDTPVFVCATCGLSYPTRLRACPGCKGPSKAAVSPASPRVVRFDSTVGAALSLEEFMKMLGRTILAHQVHQADLLMREIAIKVESHRGEISSEVLDALDEAARWLSVELEGSEWVSWLSTVRGGSGKD